MRRATRSALLRSVVQVDQVLIERSVGSSWLGSAHSKRRRPQQPGKCEGAVYTAGSAADSGGCERQHPFGENMASNQYVL